MFRCVCSVCTVLRYIGFKCTENCVSAFFPSTSSFQCLCNFYTYFHHSFSSWFFLRSRHSGMTTVCTCMHSIEMVLESLCGFGVLLLFVFFFSSAFWCTFFPSELCMCIGCRTFHHIVVIGGNLLHKTENEKYKMVRFVEAGSEICNRVRIPHNFFLRYFFLHFRFISLFCFGFMCVVSTEHSICMYLYTLYVYFDILRVEKIEEYCELSLYLIIMMMLMIWIWNGSLFLFSCGEFCRFFFVQWRNE